MMTRLEGRSIVVTGGATGIGRAICLRLAREGARVAVNYRARSAEAEELRKQIAAFGGNVRLAQADVTDETEVARMIEQLAADGGIDSFVHAASAPLRDGRFARQAWQNFENHWGVAVKAAYLLTRAFLAQPAPTKLHAIVFVLSSVTLGVPPAEKSAYTTAKCGLLGLARSLAVELAPREIRVNSLSPGFAETPLTAAVDSRLKEMIARAVPLKRLAPIDEIAAAAAYLLSAESAYLTGVNLPVAGGAVM